MANELHIRNNQPWDNVCDQRVALERISTATRAKEGKIMATSGKNEVSGPVISGGHLVAKALKNEGVEVIWT